MAFRKGDPVTFTEGSYCGETGMIVRVDNGNYYMVQLSDKKVLAPESALMAFKGRLNNG